MAKEQEVKEKQKGRGAPEAPEVLRTEESPPEELASETPASSEGSEAGEAIEAEESPGEGAMAPEEAPTSAEATAPEGTEAAEAHAVPETVLMPQRTSIMQFQVAVEGYGERFIPPDGREFYDNTRKYAEEILEDETIPAIDKLNQGKPLMKNLIGMHDMAWAGIQGAFTKMAIQIGLMALIFKDKCKEAGLPWEKWAVENLGDVIKLRTLQDYMALAKRRDCYLYAWLDRSKLMVLVAKTEKDESPDPIGNFLRKHGISVDEAREGSYLEFRTLVDTALAMEKIDKAQIAGVDRSKVQDLIHMGVKFEGGLLKDLKIITQAGGSADAHLDSLLRTGGKTDKALEPQKALESFNVLSGRIQKTVKYLMSDTDQALLRQVDPKVLNSLLDMLTRLLRVMDIKQN